MDYLNTDDLDCIAYIDKKTNTVITRFIRLPNAKAAELFTDYLMMTQGVEYDPLNDGDKSKMIH